ncbi:MAG: hypothetical protein WC682_00045 [Parcubacteria group bacterium]|jgi:hypothetical protein
MFRVIKEISRKFFIFCIIFMMLFSNFPLDIMIQYFKDSKIVDKTYLGKKFPSALDNFQTPKAKALSQFSPTDYFYNASTTTINAASATSLRSHRGAVATDNVFFSTANIANQALEVGVNLGNVSLNGANKIIIASETANVTTARNYFVQICDWSSTVGVNNAADSNCTGGGWRTINNPRTTALSNVSDATYTYEVFNGYFYSGTAPGTKIDTPLTNFVSSGSFKVRYLGATNASAITFNIDRVMVETAIDPVYYPSSSVPISPFAGTNSNFYATTFASNNVRHSVTNTATNAMNFYYSFQNIQTYTGANTILVNYEGAYVSATTLTYNLAIYNFNSSGWEDLHTGAITASATSTDQVNQFAKNNVTLTDYISSGEVRIRIYSTVTGTQTFQSDMIAITVGSTNTDVTQSETSFGQETGSTTATNTRDLDVLTTSTAGNTWQHATCLNNAIAGACTAVTYPYATDWAGTWGTNYSASANVFVPITVPTDASVTGIRYAARFRSNVTTNAVQLGIKDYSGQFAGPTVAGGWTAVGATNALTTFTFTDGIYQVNPEDYIDTINNRGNLRLRTSTSTATATATRAWDFAFMSIRWINDTVPRPTSLSQFSPTDYFYNASTTTINAASATSLRSHRGAVATDNVFFSTANIANQALEVGVNLGNVSLNGANKIIIASETANVTTARNYFVQICDWSSTVGVNNAADSNCTGGGWRTINNPRTTALSNVSDATYTYEVFNGYFYSGTAPGTKIDTPLTNFVSSGSFKVRYLGATNASAITFNIDRVMVETAIDPVYYPSSSVPISPFAGTNSNFYATTFASNNVRHSVTNTATNAMNFYYSFQNIQTYTGANTILVNYEGAYVSATTLTYNLAIYNFNSSGWEDLHTGAITASATSTDQVNQFAKNNVTLTDYISSGEVRIRIYSTVTGTQTFQSDMIAITVGSTNTDVTQSETSFGQETGSTTATNTRDLDVLTTSTAGNTWQHATCLNNAIAGACTAVTYPYATDWAGTWGTNYSASANVFVPITVPTDASVTGIRYAARFRSNVTTNAVQLGIKDYSGQFAGPTVAGGWTAVGATNALTTFTFTDGIYQVNPEDYIDTINNRGNLRLRTSTSTATATATRAWDFAFMSIRYTYLNGGISPSITVDTTGTQTATMNIPSSNQSVGGAFTMIRNSGSANVTGITITETGTVVANTNLANVKLFYDTTNCTYDGTESQFGSTTTFNASAKASFSGSVSVGTSQVCFYAMLDVGSGASGGETLEIQIADPSTEVTASAGTVTPASAVSISGTTTLNAGSLGGDIVDDVGNTVANPSVSFSTGLYNWSSQQSTGTLGISTQKIRITNTSGTPSWTLSIAAAANTNLWTSGGNTYDFNDTVTTGRLNVDPSVSTITPQGGCSTTGLSKGSSTYFSQGTQDSVNLVVAGGTAQTNCYWDITGISMTQDVPASQLVGSYGLNMVLTAI